MDPRLRAVLVFTGMCECVTLLVARSFIPVATTLARSGMGLDELLATIACAELHPPYPARGGDGA